MRQNSDLTTSTHLNSRESSHTRRPGFTWHPNRCFGTKRGVQPHPQDPTRSVQSPRQVRPGLRRPRHNPPR
ncbi:DUF1589 domain-containing protein [Rhodopirellula baltica]|uniref:DUF1589 domain-containing protein n=1 Tax=Rhodopirellula baltica TaxID=265606 RepID=UPI0036F3E69E